MATITRKTRVGLYCDGCLTLKAKESACVCRVMYDIDHWPLELHELRKQSARVDDLLHRLNWVVKHLVARGAAAAGETSGE